MDIVDKKTRSRMMAGIRSKDTQPEILVRKYLHAKGFRYRLHSKNLPGRPDIALAKHRAAIFIHGCFWHRHSGCKLAAMPSTNKKGWLDKFEKNIQRDAKSIDALVKSGWRVIILWECGIRGKDLESDLKWLPDTINNSRNQVTEWPSITK